MKPARHCGWQNSNYKITRKHVSKSILSAVGLMKQNCRNLSSHYTQTEMKNDAQKTAPSIPFGAHKNNMTARIES
jgi:hypothetical protein